MENEISLNNSFYLEIVLPSPQRMVINWLP